MGALRRRTYTPRPVRLSRAIRATAWCMVAAGVAAPLLRSRLNAPPLLVQAVAFGAPVGLAIARAALADPRRRDLLAADVGLPGGLQDAARRRGRAGAAGPRPLPDRPSIGCSGSASCRRCASSVRLRASARDGAELAHPGPRAGVGALELVPGAARHLLYVMARRPERVLPRRRADLRGVRHRRKLLLARSDGPAVVRGIGGQRGACTSRRRCRRMMVEYGEFFWQRRLGLALQCVRRQSPCSDALSALRHIRDGSSDPPRGGAGVGRARS